MRDSEGNFICDWCYKNLGKISNNEIMLHAHHDCPIVELLETVDRAIERGEAQE
jgi:hypothetical protein